MGKNIKTYKLTKKIILDKVSQITIFSTYLNLPIQTINECIATGELICSPIRDDVHPTCGFKYDNKGKLKFKDFAGYFWGDCFDIVALIISSIYNIDININNNKDFLKVLQHISFTFKDIFYGLEKDINLINEINNSLTIIKHTKPIIEVAIRNWNENDIKYWKQFGVSISLLNINFVYPVNQFYINRKINPQPKYYYDENDPCYAYYLGKDRYNVDSIKLYFPNRNKTKVRFITNCNHLEGIYNLNKKHYDYIIITKSTKDRLSINGAVEKYNFLYGEKNTINIGIINIPHETYKLRINEYSWIRNKVNNEYNILSIMDNDRTGKIEAKWLRDNYNIIPLLIPKEYDAKDFAELCSKCSENDLIKIIINTINYIKNDEQNNKSIRNTQGQDTSLPF